MPAGEVANDILLLVIESENQAISLTTANGFVQVTNSPQSAGTAGVDPANRIAVYWKRAVGSDAAPVPADSGDHTTCQIHAFRGAITTGNPWNITTGSNNSGTNSTSSTIAGGTTDVINTLVVIVQGLSNNATSTTNCSSFANSDLGTFTKRTDNSNTAGLGGGHCMFTGTKAAIGTYGNTTGTLSATSFQGQMTIALKPPPETGSTGSIVDHIILGSLDNNGFTTPSLNTTGATWLAAEIVNTNAAGCSISDSKSNTWTQWGTQTAGPVITIYRVDTPTVGSGHTFTVTCTGEAPTIAVQAWSGTTGSPPADQFLGGNVHPGGTLQVGSITPSTATNVVMSAIGHFITGTQTIDSGFTILDQVGTVGGTSYGLAFAYKSQTSATAANPTWTLTSSNNIVGANFNIKTAAAGGGLVGRMGTLGVGK